MAAPKPDHTFYFYDLETSGFSPTMARVVQFAGQRTDLELNPIGEPTSELIRLSEDILPDPDAVLITGITPQKTHEDGLTEAEFLKIFTTEICQPGTIFVGFNSVRFDDEFMRNMLYRNFYDAYEWSWKNGCSRWDVLDVVRMTRALRPEGINWPVASDGSPENRLESLTKLNGLDHQHAHDALNDVQATIQLARLVLAKQPKLFKFLLDIRSKDAVKNLVNSGQPFVYTSGKYRSEFQKTSVAGKLGDHPDSQAALVFDLRFNPLDYIDMTVGQLVEAWRWQPADYQGPRLPVKTLKFNRCPAIAPLSVLDKPSQERLKLDLGVIQSNFLLLNQNSETLMVKLQAALKIMNKEQQANLFVEAQDVDSKLYDGFIGDNDKIAMQQLRHVAPAGLQDFLGKFKDDRLNQLLPLYKARNFRQSLSSEERTDWEKFCHGKLLLGGTSSKLAKYFERIAYLKGLPATTERQKGLLVDLELYGQSLLPVE
jgi:exodeoxyribonuclease I